MTKTFRDLGVHEALCEALGSLGITHPFPIQELTLPLALDGNDLIGQARTGTGKTLAFGLPLLQRIDPKRKATQALVIAPTRELASQVHEDLSIGKALGLTSVCVYGGVPYEEQIEALQGGVHIVVGTPGRLLDHLNRRNLDLSNVTQLVLDEADEMLDMGFLPDVERLIEACQGEGRHTMLFSATMPTAIVRLARRYMEHPTFTRADHEEKNTAPLVTQHFFQVHRMDKPRVLARILQSPDRGGVYVFVRTKHMADRLVNELEELGTPAIPIHGDLRQTAREKNLERFRSGKATVLVATEVAARGLDVSGVTHVVNYDCPDDEKMYLHRIGRTARAGEAGVAVTFAEFNEADRLNVIRKAVGATDTEVLPIFSTSQELIDLFDLPEGKPWDAQVQAKVDEERDNQQRRRQDADKRTGRTDGRSKNSRQREGRGDRHDAKGRAPDQGRSRSSERDEDTTRSRSRGSDRSGDGASRSRSRQGERAATDSTSARGSDGAERERVRTRTRTRSRTADENTAGAETQRDGRSDGGRTRGSDDRGGSRQRARDRGGDSRGRERGGDDSRGRERRDDDSRGRERRRDDDSGTDRQRKRARSTGSGRSEGSKGDGKRSGAASAPHAESDKADDRARQKGSDGGRSSSRGSGGRSRGSGNRSRSGSRSGGSGKRSGGSGRSGGNGGSGERSGKRQGDNGAQGKGDASVTVARPGAEARGEGQPQLARRVKVEKLP